jgi:predicted translin family RNA/ssDNA-binding protein
MVQEQSGILQQLHDTILKITLTEAYVNSLQDENDQMTDQLNQLQQNLPSTAVKDAYSE